MPQILMPYTVHLDHTLRVTPLNTLFAKGDSAAHRFELTILSAGVPDDLSGCTVLGKFYRMADSTVVSVPGSVEDGKAVVALSEACYDYIGRFALTISIKKGEEETTVFYGDGYMHGQRADTAISGEYIIYDINTLLEKIAEIDAATQAANTAASTANTATANANTARDAANTAASTANTAATNANTAKDAANAAAGKIDAMTVSATPLETGTATAELSTVDGHYHLALGLPKGDTGATPQISVQVQTGAAGSEAQVSVSGTAEEPVILLTIPRGDVGDIGSLTINGKTPDGSGAVTLTPGDLGAATEEEVSALKNEKVDKSLVINNFATTEEGYVADARALKTLNDNKLEMKILWVNASPNSEFANQFVALELSVYNFVDIVTRDGVFRTSVGKGSVYLLNVNTPSGVFTLYRREITATSTGIRFYDAKTFKPNSSTNETQNNNFIPIEIYGIKGVS